MSTSQLISEFLIDREARGARPKTLTFYRDQLRYFANWLEAHNLELLDIEAGDLRTYRLERAANHQPNGVAASWRAIRALLNYLSRELQEPRLSDLVNRVGGVKVPKALLDPATPQEVEALLGTCKRGRFLGDRDSAIILTLYHGGLRSGELLGLGYQDFDAESHHLILRGTKGGQPRIAVLSATATKALLRWTHHLLAPKGEDALFISQRESRLTYWAMRTMLARRSRMAGLPKSILPHALRRGFCVALLRAGIPTPLVQSLGGWQSAAAMRPYEKFSTQDLGEVLARLSPFDRK